MAEDTELPQTVIDEAERLTRRAREAADPNEAAAYREKRETLLAEHNFIVRIREEDRDTLVLHPAGWVDDDRIQLEQIDDLDRGVERPLEGPGEADEWEATETHNRELAERVEAEHGSVHGANAHALADFASNHYAKPIERLTGEELQEFYDDYFPRNAWPTDDQKAVVEESVQLVLEIACEPTERAR